ncbi:MAG: hypothetical protein VKO21_12135 [Candidatus Sericytochromatia bacterium]|nr:hypothetical protein [Candidatus Sericytochromatia bacterium]
MRKSTFTLALAALALGGCEYRSILITDPTVVSAPAQNSQPTNGTNNAAAITLNALEPNPTNVANANDKISFSVVAHNANKLPMEYTWTATKGTLSGTKGQTVTWMPLGTDGKLESGVATIQCLITDSAGATKTAAVNIFIKPDGSASKVAAEAE